MYEIRPIIFVVGMLAAGGSHGDSFVSMFNGSNLCTGPTCADTCDGDPSGRAIFGSGAITSYRFQLAGFDALRVDGTFNVSARQSSSSRVVVHADDNLRDHLDVRVEQGVLILGLKPGSYCNISLEAQILLPQLLEVTANGSSHVRFAGFSNKRISLHASGVSRISGRDGRADSVRITGVGSATVDLLRSRIREGELAVDGASEVALTLDEDGGKLRGRITGVSMLDYCGRLLNDELTVEGVSSIRRRNDCHVD